MLTGRAWVARLVALLFAVVLVACSSAGTGEGGAGTAGGGPDPGRGASGVGASGVGASRPGPRRPALAVCPPRRPPAWLPSPATAADATLELSSGGRARRALVVLPAGFDPAGGHPWPLLVDLHGHGQSAEVAARTHGFATPASRAGIVVVYPQGLPQADGRTGWSTGAPGRDVTGVDDVDFVIDLLARLDRDLCLDPDRRWVAGHSNGGGLVGVLACDRAAAFTGFVAIAGAFYVWPEPCTPAVPVRLLEIHGDADTVIGYGGGGPLPSIPSWLAGWAARLGCAPDAIVIRVAGPPAGTRSDWRCPAPAALAHLRIGGGTHGVADGAAAVALDFLLQR